MSEKKKKIHVKDLRTNRDIGSKVDYWFNISESQEYRDLYRAIEERIKTQEFVLCLPNRTPLTAENYPDLSSNQMLVVYETVKQKLSETMKYSVNIAPHPDTITKSGMYEYYDSRGIDSVVISIAELIDNSLSATKANDDLRLIEIRYYDNGSDSMLVVLDNGHGMDCEELKNWAKFKYSKFVRNKSFISNDMSIDSGIGFDSSDLPLRPRQTSTPLPSENDYTPRYLDSEINYFGAGGKQAIFNIGQKTTMISKKRKSPDISELTLSKEVFDRKSQSDPEEVYKEEISVRSKGKERELSEDAKISDEIENAIIDEMEEGFSSFSICCIKNVWQRHQSPLKRGINNATNWTKGLARIYHYYIHGPKGNVGGNYKTPQEYKRLEIYIKIYEVKKHYQTDDYTLEVKHNLNLRHINDDFETQLVRSSADTFEFIVKNAEKRSDIEGIIRYHPYLDDHETLPGLPTEQELGETSSVHSSRTSATEVDDDNEDFKQSEVIKNRTHEVFECFWHGRLIPQNSFEFDWTKPEFHKDIKGLEECFNRLSGALFTNCCYEVSQNKQSFIDLSKALSQKHVLTFFRVSETETRRTVRGSIEKEFLKWLINCHTKHDKQVKYLQKHGEVQRMSLPTLRKFTRTDVFSVFHAIEWRNKKWKKGDIIQTKGTKPSHLIGVIERFLAPIKLNSSQEYVGSPGFIEIYQIPAKIHGSGSDASKMIFFNQMDIEVNANTIEKDLNKLIDKLPASLELTFPEQFKIKSGDEIPAGRPIGDIQLKVKNSKGNYITDKIPFKNAFKKLSVQLEILRVNGAETETVIDYPIANWHKQWDYWFIKNENGIKESGKYRIVAVCVYSSTNSVEASGVFADGEPLPVAPVINFTVTSGPPKHFVIVTKTLNVKIGEPFDLSLELYDEYNNSVTINDNILKQRPQLVMSGFEVTFKKLESMNKTLVIKDIVIVGEINSLENVLEVVLPSLKKQEIILNLRIGNPFKICVNPEHLEFINGSVPQFGALVYDKGGNDVTFSHQRHQVICRFLEVKQSVKTFVTAVVPLIEGSYCGQRSLVFNKSVTIRGTAIPTNLRTFLIRLYLSSNPRINLEKTIILMRDFKPTSVRLFFTNTVNDCSESIEILNEKTLSFPAGSALSGVYFKAFDCEGNEIDLNQFESSVVTVSWAQKPISITPDGTLPQIIIQTSTQELRKLTLNWRQLKRNINLEHNFYLQPFADSPQRIEVKLSDNSITFPVGHVVTECVYVLVFDQYNNLIHSTDVLDRLCIKPVSQDLVIEEKLVKKLVSKEETIASYEVSNIKLSPNERITSNNSVIGENRLEFGIRGMESIVTHLDITVVNGTPHELKWLNTGNNCITVTNHRRLQLECRLYDGFNNPILNPELSAQLVLGPNFCTNRITARLNPLGIASFSDIIKINTNIKSCSDCKVPEDLGQGVQRCNKSCFGFNKVFAFLGYNGNTIKTTDYWVHILCNNKNPLRLEVKHTRDLTVVTKTPNMPIFEVTVFSEGNSVITNFDAKQIAMHLISVGQNEEESHVQFLPTECINDVFQFRVDMAPLPNKYRVKFVCNGIQTIEKYFDEYINVIPGPPIKLMLMSDPLKDPIIVSNNGTKRVIIESQSPLILDVVDANDVSIYQNISPQVLETNALYFGTLSAQIISAHDLVDSKEIPELEGSDRFDSRNRLTFHIKKGKVIINELKLKENTKGINFGNYFIEFKANLNNSVNLEPFRLKIMFCDDVGIQKELHLIQMDINNNEVYRKNILKEMKNKKDRKEQQTALCNGLQERERELSKNLSKLNENNRFTDEDMIESKITEYENKLRELEVIESNRVMRGITISDAPISEGIIGKLAHLAFIEDEESSQLISWYLKDHMSCVVTKTAEMAEKIREGNDIQSTISLDRIPADIPNFSARLPYDDKFNINPYNICYARTLIRINPVFEDMEQQLKNVFTSILGNALICFNIKDAEIYRKRGERFGKCPTIITKSGVLYDNGIIDKSIPPEQQNFVSFQKPPNDDYLRIPKILELLTKLKETTKQITIECKKLKELEKEFNEFNESSEKEISELDRTISVGRNKFLNLSQSSINDSLNDSFGSNHNNDSNNNNSHKRLNRSGPLYSDTETNNKRLRRY